MHLNRGRSFERHIKETNRRVWVSLCNWGCVSPYLHSEVTQAAGEHLKHWVEIALKDGTMHHKGSWVNASHHGGGRTTRVFIAIDESTTHGTYYFRSFGLAPSVLVQVCASEWDYESDRTVCERLFNRLVIRLKISALAELIGVTNGLWSCIAYSNCFMSSTHSYKDDFDQRGIISTKK